MTAESNLSTLRAGIRSSQAFLEHDLFGKPLHTFPDHALAAGRSAGIIRRHAGARRLAVVVQPGIACRFTRRRTLLIGLMYALRTLLVARLILSALVLD